MLETLLDTPARWLSTPGPDTDAVLSTHGVLFRNLAEYPFPARCSTDDKLAIEDRVRTLLTQQRIAGTGEYFALTGVDARETRLIAERYLATDELLRGGSARGVFITADQGLCVMINGANHLSVQAIAPGLQPQEVWNRLNAVDDAMTKYLDFAYDTRLGYLTSDLITVGTGLRMTAVLHLTGLVLTNRMQAVLEQTTQSAHVLRGLAGEGGETKGDLYQLSNRFTLGRSEDEIAFHLRQKAGELVRMERAARSSIQEEGPEVLHDRVRRALGIAREARLIESDEAIHLVAALRLGVATGLLDGYNMEQLNELLVTSQRAHMELRQGAAVSDLVLNKERADLFRARFS